MLVLYHTTSVDGKDVAVSGTVAIPKGPPPAGGWPVVSWAHGTTGDAAECAPSRDEAGGPERWYLKDVDDLLDDYVQHGSAVVQTDYEGIGTPGVHPYLVGVAEGRDAIDIVRAARGLDSHVGTRYVVIGHSQGGQSALFAASIAPAWAPELQLLGAVALAPASHLGPWLRGLATASEPDLGFGFAGLLVRGYASIDPTIRPDALFARGAEAFEAQLETRCVLGLLQRDSWAGLTPAKTFAPGADFGPLLQRVAQNEPGSLRIGVPALLLQGTGDEIVAPIASDLLARELCAQNVALSYDPVADADHNGLVLATLGTAQAWIDARFAGAPAASNCADLPRAQPQS
jgi:pimeloyl-ACP methyl ester carboxylesterase